MPPGQGPRGFSTRVGVLSTLPGRLLSLSFSAAEYAGALRLQGARSHETEDARPREDHVQAPVPGQPDAAVRVVRLPALTRWPYILDQK